MAHVLTRLRLYRSGLSARPAHPAFVSDPAGTLAGVDRAVAAEPLLARALGCEPAMASVKVHAVIQVGRGPAGSEEGCRVSTWERVLGWW